MFKIKVIFILLYCYIALNSIAFAENVNVSWKFDHIEYTPDRDKERYFSVCDGRGRSYQKVTSQQYLDTFWECYMPYAKQPRFRYRLTTKVIGIPGNNTYLRLETVNQKLSDDEGSVAIYIRIYDSYGSFKRFEGYYGEYRRSNQLYNVEVPPSISHLITMPKQAVVLPGGELLDWTVTVEQHNQSAGYARIKFVYKAIRVNINNSNTTSKPVYDPRTYNPSRQYNSFCDDYAKSGTNQWQQNLNGQCGYRGGDGGAGWSAQYEDHYNWCRRVSASEVKRHREIRFNLLAKCSNQIPPKYVPPPVYKAPPPPTYK